MHTLGHTRTYAGHDVLKNRQHPPCPPVQRLTVLLTLLSCFFWLLPFPLSGPLKSVSIFIIRWCSLSSAVCHFSFLISSAYWHFFIALLPNKNLVLLKTIPSSQSTLLCTDNQAIQLHGYNLLAKNYLKMKAIFGLFQEPEDSGYLLTAHVNNDTYNREKK